MCENDERGREKRQNRATHDAALCTVRLARFFLVLSSPGSTALVGDVLESEETSKRERVQALRRRNEGEEKKKLTIAVALAGDRLPLSETRDVDVLLRSCFFLFFRVIW